MHAFARSNAHSLLSPSPHAALPPTIHSHPAQLVAPDNLESKFLALEGSDVDDELSKMKAQLAASKPVAQVCVWGAQVGWLGFT